MSNPTTDSILRADAISLAYFDGDQATYALSEVSVELPARGFVGVMGPSGSGKSSLLYVLSGLKRASSGEVRYGDQEFGAYDDARLTKLRRDHFGFVFQQPWLLGWQTAAENTLMGAPDVDDEARARVGQYFDQLGMTAFTNKMPSQLSGGEKQRVCVARAMMNNPSVIFADEPTASLDHRNGHLVVDLLAQYRERGLVIIVTHDAEMVQGADQVLIMRDGRTVEWVSASEARTGRIYPTTSLN